MRENQENERKANERYEKFMQEQGIKTSSIIQDEMEVRIYPAKFDTDFFSDFNDEF